MVAMGLWLTMMITTAMGSPSVLGDWIGPTQSVVRVEPCGTAICARIVKLPPHSPATVDLHNPDAALRGRPLCGVDIGTGFAEATPGNLTGGHLYDPTSGKTYKGSMTLDGDNLKLRGYVGVSLFGRSETWTRVAAVKACE